MQSDSKQIKSNNSPYNLNALRDYTLRIIVNSTTKVTPPALEKRLIEKYGITKRLVKSVLRELVAEGELAYTYEYGCTFIERSFNKPVRVSKHIILQPPGYHQESEPDDVVVQINPGVSFGAGNHPTTRLALKGIEFVLLGDQVFDKKYHTRVLDIGTGSGVLLITALLCGVESGLGLDIDACARVEAAENIKSNGLKDRAVVSKKSVAEIHQRFSMILANLRYPTLKRMLFETNELAAATCLLVLSGIREYELDDLVKTYEKIKFEKLWVENELGWSGVVLQRI
jgi:ribosomal protein L11 methyltransferase